MLWTAAAACRRSAAAVATAGVADTAAAAAASLATATEMLLKMELLHYVQDGFLLIPASIQHHRPNPSYPMRTQTTMISSSVDLLVVLCICLVLLLAIHCCGFGFCSIVFIVVVVVGCCCCFCRNGVVRVNKHGVVFCGVAIVTQWLTQSMDGNALGIGYIGCMCKDLVDHVGWVGFHI